jgi:hypothetical protein
MLYSIAVLTVSNSHIVQLLVDHCGCVSSNQELGFIVVAMCEGPFLVLT